jgi:hypothetical protein
MWRKSIRFIEEGDLTVGYLRSFIYDDWQLVDLILERDTDEITLANRISTYLGDRLSTITKISEKDVDEFELRVASTDPDSPDVWSTPPKYASCLHFDPDVGARGMNRLEELRQDLTAPIPSSKDASGYAKLLSRLDEELLSARSFVYLGSSNVQVNVRGGRCFITANGKTVPGDIPTSSADGQGSGTVDLFYEALSPVQRRIVHISREDETIATVVRGLDHDSSAPLDFHPSMSRASLRHLNGLFEQILDENLSERWLKVALDHINGSAPDVARSIYLDTALGSVSDEYLAETLEALTEGGIRALLHEDRDLAEALVVAGTVTQATPFYDFVVAVLQREGFEPGVLHRLAEIGRASLPLVTIGKGPNPHMLTFV